MISNSNNNCCIIDILPSKCHTTAINNNDKIEQFTCKICLNKFIDDCLPSNTTTSTNTLTLSSSEASTSSTTSASSSSFDINSILNSDENDDLLLNAMSEHDYDTLGSFKSPISSSSIYEIQSCKCKFCVNVSRPC
jgi:hypothetical protein